MPETSPIPYWLPVDENLGLGAQIDQTGLEWLASQGFTTIVNLNLPEARNYWPEEAERAREAGVEYVHHPLDCSTLDAAKYAAFKEILDARRDGKVFVHCAMNVKSSGMAHVWRVQELSHDPQAARADLARTPGHEPKWEKFWKEMGV